MQIKNVTSFLEELAPLAYQESYDNAGLIVGNPDTPIKAVLVSLDATEKVVEEAIQRECNLIVAHHPIVFKGLKRLNGSNYVERTVIKAIQNDIAIYAIHTNLDNVLHQGVNAKIAEKIGLQDTQILAPKRSMRKLQVFVPVGYSDQVRNALFAAGGGQVADHYRLSHSSLGVDSRQEAEVKLELLFAAHQEPGILKALEAAHPLEHPVYDISTSEVINPLVGSGLLGRLPKAMPEKAFLERVKKRMKASMLRYTRLRGRPVNQVAVCGGAGSFLLPAAKAARADVFITSDYKYHEFFDADKRIVIADIGHYESEQFTIELLNGIINNKFRTFAAYSARTNTNPVRYL